MTGLEKYLEEYRRARNVQSEVMAVNRFVGPLSRTAAIAGWMRI